MQITVNVDEKNLMALMQLAESEGASTEVIINRLVGEYVKQHRDVDSSQGSGTEKTVFDMFNELEGVMIGSVI